MVERLVLLTAVGVAAACKDDPPADTGQPDPDPLALIDADGDGILEPEDLYDGQSAAWFTVEEPGSDPVEIALKTEDAVFAWLEGSSWYVQSTFDFEPPYEVVVRFENGSTLTERTGDLEHVNVAHLESGFFANADSPGVLVDVTFVGGGRGSGLVDDAVVLHGVDTTSGDPTDTIVTVHGVVFRSLPY